MMYRRRLVTLDGMRGVAAIAVALFHFDYKIVRGGYLAVDFFFVLSGFVLERSYAVRFAAGLTAGQFMKVRWIRLFPLYFCGLVIGAAFAVQGILRGSDNHLPIPDFVVALVCNTLMLPSPLTAGNLFPINGPSWSLFNEALPNILLAVVLRKLGWRLLAVIAVAAAVALPFAVVRFETTGTGRAFLAMGVPGTAAGAEWAGLIVGLLRMPFSFTMGVLVARLPLGRGPRDSTVVVVACLAGLVAVLAWKIAPSRLLFDLLAVWIGFPALVAIGSCCEPRQLIAPLAGFVGEISYALYAIHTPIAHGFQFLARRLGVDLVILAPAYVAMCIVTAWVCVAWLDLPLRRWLNVRLGD